jgi:hypothetical protein
MRQRRRIGAILIVLAVAAAIAALTATQTRTASHAYIPQATGDTGEGTEMLAANQQLAQRTGSSMAVKAGAYAAAMQQKAKIAARGNSVAGSTASWKAYGHGPLIGDDSRMSRVKDAGMADLGGRVNHFAYDPKSGRLFASAGQGGVWALDKGSTTWRSIGDNLPTQAVGGIGFSPAGTSGTLIVLTGNDVFGGGTTFSGLGAYRSTDLGKTWTKASGIPNGVNSFQVAVDPTNANIVYAATGAGLFQSTDAGKSYRNVKLPVSPAGSVPNCTGALPTVEGCYLANMVTDVVVRAPGGVGANKKGGAVIAAVGWRAGNKTNKSRLYPSYVESPGNGIYRSPTGAPGTFTKLDQSSFTGDSNPIGRIELGAAVGPLQNHDYLYAIVQDATPFQGGSDVGGIDAPGLVGGQPSKYTTYLKGIYSSADFGQTWTRMAGPTELMTPGNGSSLTFGLACDDPRQTYCPGVQAWYNEWIQPDPTRADANGVPTRLTFGLEEVWENTLADQNVAADGPTNFKVIGSYIGGTNCLFLVLSFPACPTSAGYGSTTVHPDHHAGFYVPDGLGGVTLYDGNDGGVGVQHVAAGQALSNANWGRGLNNGFNTLMPYMAVMAKDGRAYGGLQDNGELRVDPDGTQYNTHDGDGTWSAVDPNNSNTVYERQPGGQIQVSDDGGQTWSATGSHSDTFQFVNPFVMDPASSSHLLDAGNLVWESTDAGGTWTQVFSLGSSPAGVAYAMSALDVRSQRYGPPLPTGPHTADFAYTDGATTVPAGQSGTVDIPGTYADHDFTIGPNEGDARVDVKITWADPTFDWDLYLYRDDNGTLVLVKNSGSFNAETGVAAESVTVPDPTPGNYVIRVVNSSAVGTFDASVKFTQRTETIPSLLRNSAYVAFCGTCDALNARPFDNGIATNVGGATEGAPLSTDGWHRASARGLPKRFITSIISDTDNPMTVYVTLAGYSRRWMQVGAMGELPDPAKGNVFKSTDAGETFTNITGNLPDSPAESVLVYKGKLIVGTDTGVYISRDLSGLRWELLGKGLPNVPVFSMAFKPKASASEPDTLYIGTHGRSIYTYQFPAGS